MFIRISDLELRQAEYDESFRPGMIEFGPDLRQVGPLKIKGRAELIKEHLGGKSVVLNIRLVGKWSGDFEASCARCLEPVAQRLEREYDLLYRPLGSDRRADEVSISEAETEIGYYQGEGMELADSLREQVLLAAPVKVVCSEACKGICAQCGKNLNEGSCNCAPVMTDPRWDALKDLKKNLQ
ncbi:MAG TPA: DUF177 domain-containing protein [Terriglobales bacterium]